jgi:hypothetical protein
MQFIGVLKRILPFFLTFAVGLFVASFFVTLPAAPKFERKHRGHKFAKCKKMYAENDQLRSENERLQMELEELRRMESVPHGHGWGSGDGIKLTVPAPPDAPLAPPLPPAPMRELKMKTVTVK